MKSKRKWKGLVIFLVVLLVVAAAGGGAWWYFTQNRTAEPVNVFPFQYVGMTEYWGDSQESHGPVYTDAIQTVFLSDTQTVVEVCVKQGDTVKKGDLLMRFDTTLTDLALERERLAVEKLKLQLSDAQSELKKIKKMKPMVIPTVLPQPTLPQQDLGTAIPGEFVISQNKSFDGSSREKALICWLRDNVSVTDEILEQLQKASESYRQTTQPPAPTEPSAPTETTEPTEATEPSDPTDPVEPSDPTQPTQPEALAPVEKFFVVFKTTQGNLSLAATTVWQGMEVTFTGDRFTFKLFDASAFADHSVVRPPVEMPTMPQIDFGSGYTASQLAQMRSDKEKQIKDLQFQVKMAQANYAIKQTEIESGDVLADIDGTVVSLLSEEEAKTSMQPIMKISGGGGFYVEGFVSELTKDQLLPGQEVTVNDWNTGMVYTGKVQSVGDFPQPDGYWNGMGNPNASYYPFTVFIDGSADLQEGSFVNVVYSTATSQQGIYLENPFLRTEDGQTYVYVRGQDERLEKRPVTTGKALWGSYTEILSGLTPEDLIAFPYGKTVVEGAPTAESDLSALYG